jgi:hypothetical protein
MHVGGKINTYGGCLHCIWVIGHPSAETAGHTEIDEGGGKRFSRDNLCSTGNSLER